MDLYDRERAQHQAKEGARNMYDEHYGNSERYDPDQQDAPHHFRREGREGREGRGGGGGGYGGEYGGGYGGRDY